MAEAAKRTHGKHTIAILEILASFLPETPVHPNHDKNYKKSTKTHMKHIVEISDDTREFANISKS